VRPDVICVVCLVGQAIKMIRNNDTMRKAAQKELEILKEIAAADPENKKHCVRLLHHFEHRNHVALVFEAMQMNLRNTLQKFGKHVGINIPAVRTYAKQLLVALKVGVRQASGTVWNCRADRAACHASRVWQHIGNLKVVHADIKPDNILVSDGFVQVGIRRNNRWSRRNYVG
jgi:serine/threonine-protein kinase PRP4